MIESQIDALLLNRAGKSLPTRPQPVEATAPSGLTGLGRVASQLREPAAPASPARNVSTKLAEAAGSFRLDLRPSGVPHRLAGQGVWLQGEAHVGQVSFERGRKGVAWRSVPGWCKCEGKHTCSHQFCSPVLILAHS